MSTQGIARLIQSIENVQQELRYHIERLTDEWLATRPPDERAHLLDLRHGYELSHHYLRILRRYQQGRVRRMTGVSHNGTSSPYFEEDRDG